MVHTTLDVHMRDPTDDPGLIMEHVLTNILPTLVPLDLWPWLHSLKSFLSSLVVLVVILFDCWTGTDPPLTLGHRFGDSLNIASGSVTQLGNSHIVLNSLTSVYIYCLTGPSASHNENELWNTDFPNIHHAIYDITSVYNSVFRSRPIVWLSTEDRV